MIDCTMRKKKQCVWIQLWAMSLLTLFIIPNGVVAEEYKLIYEDKGQIYLDTTEKLTIKEVTATKFDHNFKDAMGADAVLHNFEHSYWYRFKIINRSHHLDLVFRPLINAHPLEVYFQNGNQVFTKAKIYKTFSFLGLNIPMPKPYFVLHHPQSTQFCYIRLKVNYYTGIGYEVRALPDLLREYIGNFSYFGFFVGVVLVITLFNLALFYKLREKIYFYYFTYTLSLALYALVSWGFLNSFLFSTFWLNLIYSTPYSCITLSLLCYTQHFFQAKRRYPQLHIILRRTVVVKLILFLISISTGYYFLMNRYTDNLLLVPALILGLLAFKDGYKPALYFLIALFIIYLGMLITALSSILNIQDSDIILFNLALCEIVLFSIALADRLRNLKREKEMALQQTVAIQANKNKELEENVAQRTDELKLASLEIVRMNELLKSYTKKLETKVKEVSQERVVNKQLDFEAFKEIFPDEEACLKYLSELKWSKEFECRKCQNTSYFLVKNSLSRRCTRCRYIESPMVNTIFDNIKFPLVKAFYLLFVVSSGMEISIEHLSKMMELRSATCSSFRKKILSTIRETKKAKGSSAWSNLILQKL